MPSSQREILAAIQAANWAEVVDRLVLFTIKRLRRMGWWGVQGNSLPRGLEPQDLVHDAVSKLLSGERVWKDPQKVSLLALLMGIIRSDISHLVESLESKTTVRATHPSRAEEDDVSTPMLDIANIVDHRFDMPGSTLHQVCEDALKCVHDDPLLCRIVQVMVEEGLEKPRDIAEHIGVPLAEIYKAKRRLKERLKELRGEG